MLEYVSQGSADLPATSNPEVGPDGTGVGWCYLYGVGGRTGGYEVGLCRGMQGRVV